MEYELKATAGEYEVTGPDSVSFDKYVVGITSLEMLLHSLKTVKEKDTYWQWIYITLHSAVQAYMVLALSGKGPMLTYSGKPISDMVEILRNTKKLPKFKLDSYLNLYEKTKSEVFNIYPSESKLFVPTTSQDQSIKHLNKIRNDFVHYKITGLMLIMSNSPFGIVTDCLDYIEFLAFQSNNIIWHNEQYKTETEKLLSECRSVIEASDKIVGGR